MEQQTREFLRGLSRAVGGALLFGLPLFMTMEMWSLGFYMSRWRLLFLLTLTMPLLVGLSFYSGFRKTFNWREDVVDALVAYAVGMITALLMLFATGVLTVRMSLHEIAGVSILQAIPGSMGALLAQSQLGASNGEDPVERSREPNYGGALFLMAVGALFMAFNVAPTEEIVVIAQAAALRTLSMAIVSIIAMHGFTYAMRFKGHADVPPDTPSWQLLARFTVPGYALVLLLSALMLWIFGRLDGLSVIAALDTVIVLSVPAAIGAAAARLIL